MAIEPWLDAPTLLVTAHPDDEAVGLGSRLHSFSKLAIALITDGAPRTGLDVHNAGCAGWREYSAMRQREMKAALARVGLQNSEIYRFEYPDQQAVLHITEIATRLTEIINRVSPAFVFTHPYEGGHPDHDSASLALHLAVQKLQRVPEVLEFASYHATLTGVETERFIGQSDTQSLNAEQRDRKRAILDCYASQSSVLSMFPLEHEPLRAVPHYNYRSLPNSGLILYERWGWKLTGLEWLDHAQRAIADSSR